MRRVVVALAVLTVVSPSLAAGSAADILVQACQGLKRQSDRNKCLEEAVKSVGAQVPAHKAPDAPSPLEAARARSAKAIEASEAIQSIAASGTSLLQYTPYVQQFSIALDQFRQSAQTPEEKDAAALLAEALQAYADVGTYWQADINFFSRSDYRSTYPGAQPTGLTGTRYILDRYDVPVSKADFWGLQQGAPLSVAANVIWGYAREKTEAAKGKIASIGAPKPVEQKPPEQVAADPETKEFGTLIPKVVPIDFKGGAYSSPDLDSARWSGDLAGHSVYAFAQRKDWYRVSPKGDRESWLPLSAFH